MKVYEIGKSDSDDECFDCTIWIATDREIKLCEGAGAEYYVKEIPEFRGMEQEPEDLGLDFIIS